MYGLHFIWITLFAFNVAYGDIVSSNPVITESEDMDELGKVPGLLKWDRVPGVSYYEVSISRKKELKKQKKFTLDDKNRFHIRVYPGVNYYWRVDAFAQNHQLLDSSSSVFEYKVIYSGSEQSLVKGEDNDDLNVEKEDPSEDSMYEVLPVTQENILDDTTEEVFRKHKVWFSTELGVIGYKQTSLFLGDLDFEGPIFPSYSLVYQSRKYFNRFYYEVFFSNLHSRFELDRPGVSLSDNSFVWSRYGALGSYSVLNWNRWDRTFEVNFHLGLEKNKTPMFDISDPVKIDVKDISQTQVLLGVELRTHIENQWSYFTRLSYFLPISVKGSFEDMDMNSQTALDFQVGSIYYLKENLFLGFSGKTSMYKYIEVISDPNLGSFSMERQMNYFSIEGRVGFSF